MSNEQAKRKKPDDFFGIPGSGLLAQAVGTAADEADLLGDGYNLLKGTPKVPGPMGFLDKAMPWMSLAAGAKGVASGAYGLMTGEGRALDNSLGIVSGIADSAAGATGIAAASGATSGWAGTLAAGATPAGVIAGLVGLGVYGEKESTAVMQNDFWGDTINNWFTDDEGKPVSMYEAAWDQGGDMVDGARDYMGSTWLGEDVGGAIGTIGGGIGAGATLVGATAANIGIGAATAATDVYHGAGELLEGAGNGIASGYNAVADW